MDNGKLKPARRNSHPPIVASRDETPCMGRTIPKDTLCYYLFGIDEPKICCEEIGSEVRRKKKIYV